MTVWDTCGTDLSEVKSKDQKSCSILDSLYLFLSIKKSLTCAAMSSMRLRISQEGNRRGLQLVVTPALSPSSLLIYKLPDKSSTRYPSNVLFYGLSDFSLDAKVRKGMPFERLNLTLKRNFVAINCLNLYPFPQLAMLPRIRFFLSRIIMKFNPDPSHLKESLLQNFPYREFFQTRLSVFKSRVDNLKPPYSQTNPYLR